MTFTGHDCYGSPPEDLDLISFIVEKSATVVAPFSLRKLCKEFKETRGSMKQEKNLIHEVASFRHTVYSMNGLHMELRAKMIFALSAPVDDDFLVALRRIAHVEVDDFNRIIRYENFGGGLRLKGKHGKMTVTKICEYDKQIMDFLAEISKTSVAPVSNTQFATEFTLKNGLSINFINCRQRYGSIKKLVFTCPDYDEPTKVRMLFVCQARIGAQILQCLRKKAIVEIDKDLHLVYYKSFDGTLELRNEENHRSARSFRSQRFQNGRFSSRSTFPISDRHSSSSPRFLDNNSNYYPPRSPLSGGNQDREASRSSTMTHLVPLRQMMAEINGGIGRKTDENVRLTGDFYGVEHDSKSDYSIMNSEKATVDVISAKRTLLSLREFIRELDKVLLVALEKDIDKAIRKLGMNDSKVPSEEILKALDLGLIIMRKCAKTDNPDEEYVVQRDFLETIRRIFYTSTSASLNSYADNIEKEINEIGIRDKYISVKNVRPILEAVFLLAAEN